MKAELGLTPWPLHEAFSPKLARRVMFYRRPLLEHWLLLVANPKVLTFCERPGYAPTRCPAMHCSTCLAPQLIRLKAWYRCARRSTGVVTLLGRSRKTAQ